jgi:hypothetical protein
MNKLVDILTKREYLVRQLLEQNNFIINLPDNYVASPNNSLYKTLKSSFNYLDLNLLNVEQNRFNWSDGNFKTKFLILDLFHSFNLFGTFNNLNIFLNKFFNNLNNSFNIFDKNYGNNNLNFTKSQFKPMKKGIANMIKIHANGSIALPIEMRIQLLASSRDVIHS